MRCINICIDIYTFIHQFHVGEVVRYGGSTVYISFEHANLQMNIVRTGRVRYRRVFVFISNAVDGY